MKNAEYRNQSQFSEKLAYCKTLCLSIFAW